MEVFKQGGIIEPEAIAKIPGGEKEFYDYSTNLLGTYIKEDLRIKFINNEGGFHDYWRVGEDVVEPLLNQHFELNDDFFCFVMPISGLIHYKVTDPSSGKVITCHVVHTPTNCNFWHMSVRWDVNGVDNDQLTKDDRQLIRTTARSRFDHLADHWKSDMENIPLEIYSN